MSQIRVARRVLTEIIAAMAFPILLLSLLVAPASAAVLTELDRSRARWCGVGTMPLRPADQSWAQWVARQLRSRSMWRTGLPVLVAATLLSALSLAVAFFGFIGAAALVFSPVFWSFGIAAQVGPFTPKSLTESFLAMPAGVLLGAFTTVLLTGISLLRDLVLHAFSRSQDPDLLAKLEELRSSRASLTTAFEFERRRIERDLHDGAQQELVAVVMRLGMLEAAASASGEERVVELARQAQDQAEHALERLRETVREIHPRELSDLGLVAAVRELAARSPLRVELNSTGDDARLSSPTATAAYFTVSEALTNITKHAGVGSARIDLQCDSSGVRVCVRDDGAGGAEIDAGSGLAGLRERMRSIGGELEIRSPADGRGTEVIASAPGQPTWE
ncbi:MULTISPECIES: sensor histidine kinase [unclassified Streptomyces]|uniref:sensor histidine kinase n=1 Tax=unclassified Streptomyces TaxID=2593676 RepID=UPI002DDB2700|nr:sensor histidine kinase [Streptomyces sp. NBC_01237]WRZ71105.1 sensor histidine kinase [Streptomyces sp. NBC_01237]